MDECDLRKKLEQIYDERGTHYRSHRPYRQEGVWDPTTYDIDPAINAMLNVAASLAYVAGNLGDLQEEVCRIREEGLPSSATDEVASCILSAAGELASAVKRIGA